MRITSLKNSLSHVTLAQLYSYTMTLKTLRLLLLVAALRIQAIYIHVAIWLVSIFMLTTVEIVTLKSSQTFC